MKRKFRSARGPVSTANPKLRVFGYTAPLPGESAVPLKSRPPDKYSDLMMFITGTTSRFSLEDPKVYLRKASPATLSAHLRHELDIVRARISDVQRSDAFTAYRELRIRREILANELLRLEKLNSELKATSCGICEKFARYVTEIESPKAVMILREAQMFEEDSRRKLDVLRTQRDALRQRKQRELLSEMNESMVGIISERTRATFESAEDVRSRTAHKRRRDDLELLSLNGAKAAIFEKLTQFYHEDGRDIVLPMPDILVYVRTKDPIILLRSFERQQRRRAEHEFWEKVRVAEREATDT
jgi:hypothetical protein